MARVHLAVEWAKTELARGETPGQFESELSPATAVLIWSYR